MKFKGLVLLLLGIVTLQWRRYFVNGEHGYNLVSYSEFQNCSVFKGNLKVLDNNSSEYRHLGANIKELDVEVTHISETQMRVRIADARQKRWEVPQNIVPRLSANCSIDYDRSELVFSYSSKPFGFAISRRSTGEVLFDSRFENLVFKDQFLEISTALSADSSLYGIGESTRPTFRLSNDSNYTLWNSDIGSSNVFLETYGAHPFYLNVRKGGAAHGVLLLNSNGMDIKYSGSRLTYKIIGGILDFYYFSGPSPLSVVQQYTEVIGRPGAMCPTGLSVRFHCFHQCRYGYKNVSDIQTVVNRYQEEKIPLDVIWSDIDYMNNYMDFTLDPLNYPEKLLRTFIDDLHASGRKYVMIVDPGIMVNNSYPTYQRGIHQDIFIKQGGTNYIGQVWPGPVHFPDFLNPKTQNFWTNEVTLFHNKIPFDGLWIDMNEISNFCTGVSCTMPADGKCPVMASQTDCCLVCSNANSSRWDNPPYRINGSGVHRPIGNKTVPASAVHYYGTLEYNAHNLYGISEAIITKNALTKVRKQRPFVLSRSTFVGSGKHAAHWTGDNAATFNDLHYSINTVLSFGLFGIPMVGADICGFSGNTTDELCTRWIQLGAFYPFSRDHSDKNSIRQELFLWENVKVAARKALGLRYRLLPYLYTLSYEAHTFGSPIARPLFFTFPEDSNTLGVNTQYLLGKGILISPVLKEGDRFVDAYFPKGTWFNLNNISDSVTVKKGSSVRLSAPLDTINVHLYEGSIVPMQEGGLTTLEARKTPFSLVVALGEKKSAKGELFLDDGEELEMTISKGKSTFVYFSATFDDDGTLSFKSRVAEGDFALSQGWIVQEITFLLPQSSQKRVVEVPNLNYPIGADFDVSVHNLKSLFSDS